MSSPKDSGGMPSTIKDGGKDIGRGTYNDKSSEMDGENHQIRSGGDKDYGSLLSGLKDPAPFRPDWEDTDLSM